MKEENELLRTIGTKNPFKVPENYFDQFATELMDKLPEKENVSTLHEITWWDRVKPWIYMAAMFVGIMLTFKMFQDITDRAGNIQDKSIAVDANDISDQYFETITSDAMMDDYALYQYLTDADINY